MLDHLEKSYETKRSLGFSWQDKDEAMNSEEEEDLDFQSQSHNGSHDNYANYPWINKGGQAEGNSLSRRHSSKSGTFNESDKS